MTVATASRPLPMIGKKKSMRAKEMCIRDRSEAEASFRILLYFSSLFHNIDFFFMPCRWLHLARFRGDVYKRQAKAFKRLLEKGRYDMYSLVSRFGRSEKYIYTRLKDVYKRQSFMFPSLVLTSTTEESLPP